MNLSEADKLGFLNIQIPTNSTKMASTLDMSKLSKHSSSFSKIRKTKKAKKSRMTFRSNFNFGTETNVDIPHPPCKPSPKKKQVLNNSNSFAVIKRPIILLKKRASSAKPRYSPGKTPLKCLMHDPPTPSDENTHLKIILDHISSSKIQQQQPKPIKKKPTYRPIECPKPPRKPALPNVGLRKPKRCQINADLTSLKFSKFQSSDLSKTSYKMFKPKLTLYERKKRQMAKPRKTVKLEEEIHCILEEAEFTRTDNKERRTGILIDQTEILKAKFNKSNDTKGSDSSSSSGSESKSMSGSESRDTVVDGAVNESMAYTKPYNQTFTVQKVSIDDKRADSSLNRSIFDEDISFIDQPYSKPKQNFLLKEIQAYQGKKPKRKIKRTKKKSMDSTKVAKATLSLSPNARSMMNTLSLKSMKWNSKMISQRTTIIPREKDPEELKHEQRNKEHMTASQRKKQEYHKLMHFTVNDEIKTLKDDIQRVDQIIQHNQVKVNGQGRPRRRGQQTQQGQKSPPKLPSRPPSPVKSPSKTQKLRNVKSPPRFSSIRVTSTGQIPRPALRKPNRGKRLKESRVSFENMTALNRTISSSGATSPHPVFNDPLSTLKLMKFSPRQGMF